MNRFLVAPLALSSTLILGACSDTPTEPLTPEVDQAVVAARAMNASPAKGPMSIAEVAIDAGFSELVGALSYVDAELGTGLVDLFLNGDRQLTVFAPNNAAFGDLYSLLSAVLGAQIDEIEDVPASVVLDVLQYHVAPGRRAANSVVPRNGERTINPLLGEKFWVRADGTIRDGLTGLRADATILLPNISATNGIIHVIDQVIVPPSVVAALTS
jgi:transforming growth factor-beta-induced protein